MAVSSCLRKQRGIESGVDVLRATARAIERDNAPVGLECFVDLGEDIDVLPHHRSPSNRDRDLISL
jgi:hypothetical protein